MAARLREFLIFPSKYAREGWPLAAGPVSLALGLHGAWGENRAAGLTHPRTRTSVHDDTDQASGVLGGGYQII